MLEQPLVILLKYLLKLFVEDNESANEKIQIGIWSGYIVLENLLLKKSLFNNLDNLPITLHYGYIGRLELRIPWASSLSTEPITLILDRINILVEPKYEWNPGAGERREQTLKQAKLAAAELFANKKSTLKKANFRDFASNWLFQSLLHKIIDNIQITVREFHFRYEDQLSCPTNFCLGLTFESMHVQSRDDSFSFEANYSTPEQSKSDSSSIKYNRYTSSLERKLNLSQSHGQVSHKLIQMNQLAFYWNPLQDQATELCNTSFIGRDQLDIERFMVQCIATRIRHNVDLPRHHYILRPMELNVYVDFMINSSQANVKTSVKVIVSKIEIKLEDLQFCEIISMTTNMANFAKLEKFSEFRPKVGVMKDPKAWWRYAIYAVVIELKAELKSTFSGASITRRSRNRRVYIELWRRKLVTPTATLLQFQSRYDVGLSQIDHSIPFQFNQIRSVDVTSDLYQSILNHRRVTTTTISRHQIPPLSYETFQLWQSLERDLSFDDLMFFRSWAELNLSDDVKQQNWVGNIYSWITGSKATNISENEKVSVFDSYRDGPEIVHPPYEDGADDGELTMVTFTQIDQLEVTLSLSQTKSTPIFRRNIAIPFLRINLRDLHITASVYGMSGSLTTLSLTLQDLSVSEIIPPILPMFTKHSVSWLTGSPDGDTMQTHNPALVQSTPQTNLKSALASTGFKKTKTPGDQINKIVFRRLFGLETAYQKVMNSSQPENSKSESIRNDGMDRLSIGSSRNSRSSARSESQRNSVRLPPIFSVKVTFTPSRKEQEMDLQIEMEELQIMICPTDRWITTVATFFKWPEHVQYWSEMEMHAMSDLEDWKSKFEAKMNYMIKNHANATVSCHIKAPIVIISDDSELQLISKVEHSNRNRSVSDSDEVSLNDSMGKESPSDKGRDSNTSARSTPIPLDESKPSDVLVIDLGLITFTSKKLAKADHQRRLDESQDGGGSIAVDRVRTDGRGIQSATNPEVISATLNPLTDIDNSDASIDSMALLTQENVMRISLEDRVTLHEAPNSTIISDEIFSAQLLVDSSEPLTSRRHAADDPSPSDSLYDVFQLRISQIEVYLMNAESLSSIAFEDLDHVQKDIFFSNFECLVDVHVSTLPWDTSIPPAKLMVHLPVIQILLSKSKLIRIQHFNKKIVDASSMLSSKNKRNATGAESIHSTPSTYKAVQIVESIAKISSSLKESQSGKVSDSQIHKYVNGVNGFDHIEFRREPFGEEETVHSAGLESTYSLRSFSNLDAFSMGRRGSFDTKSIESSRRLSSKNLLVGKPRTASDAMNRSIERTMISFSDNDKDDITASMENVSDEGSFFSVEDVDDDHELKSIDDLQQEADEIKYQISVRDNMMSTILTNLRIMESDATKSIAVRSLEKELADCEKELHILKISYIEKLMALSEAREHHRLHQDVILHQEPSLPTTTLDLHNQRENLSELLDHMINPWENVGRHDLVSKRELVQASVFKIHPHNMLDPAHKLMSSPSKNNLVNHLQWKDSSTAPLKNQTKLRSSSLVYMQLQVATVKIEIQCNIRDAMDSSSSSSFAHHNKKKDLSKKKLIDSLSKHRQHVVMNLILQGIGLKLDHRSIETRIKMSLKRFSILEDNSFEDSHSSFSYHTQRDPWVFLTSDPTQYANCSSCDQNLYSSRNQHTHPDQFLSVRYEGIFRKQSVIDEDSGEKILMKEPDFHSLKVSAGFLGMTVEQSRLALVTLSLANSFGTNGDSLDRQTAGSLNDGLSDRMKPMDSREYSMNISFSFKIDCISTTVMNHSENEGETSSSSQLYMNSVSLQSHRPLLTASIWNLSLSANSLLGGPTTASFNLADASIHAYPLPYPVSGVKSRRWPPIALWGRLSSTDFTPILQIKFILRLNPEPEGLFSSSKAVSSVHTSPIKFNLCLQYLLAIQNAFDDGPIHQTILHLATQNVVRKPENVLFDNSDCVPNIFGQDVLKQVSDNLNLLCNSGRLEFNIGDIGIHLDANVNCDPNPKVGVMQLMLNDLKINIDWDQGYPSSVGAEAINLLLALQKVEVISGQHRVIDPFSIEVNGVMALHSALSPLPAVISNSSSNLFDINVMLSSIDFHVHEGILRNVNNFVSSVSNFFPESNQHHVEEMDHTPNRMLKSIESFGFGFSSSTSIRIQDFNLHLEHLSIRKDSSPGSMAGKNRAKQSHKTKFLIEEAVEVSTATLVCCARIHGVEISVACFDHCLSETLQRDPLAGAFQITVESISVESHQDLPKGNHFTISRNSSYNTYQTHSSTTTTDHSSPVPMNLTANNDSKSIDKNCSRSPSKIIFTDVIPNQRDLLNKDGMDTSVQSTSGNSFNVLLKVSSFFVWKLDIELHDIHLVLIEEALIDLCDLFLKKYQSTPSPKRPFSALNIKPHQVQSERQSVNKHTSLRHIHPSSMPMAASHEIPVGHANSSSTNTANVLPGPTVPVFYFLNPDSLKLSDFVQRIEFSTKILNIHLWILGNPDSADGSQTSSSSPPTSIANSLACSFSLSISALYEEPTRTTLIGSSFPVSERVLLSTNIMINSLEIYQTNALPHSHHAKLLHLDQPLGHDDKTKIIFPFDIVMNHRIVLSLNHDMMEGLVENELKPSEKLTTLLEKYRMRSISYVKSDPSMAGLKMKQEITVSIDNVVVNIHLDYRPLLALYTEKIEKLVNYFDLIAKEHTNLDEGHEDGIGMQFHEKNAAKADPHALNRGAVSKEIDSVFTNNLIEALARMLSSSSIAVDSKIGLNIKSITLLVLNDIHGPHATTAVGKVSIRNINASLTFYAILANNRPKGRSLVKYYLFTTDAPSMHGHNTTVNPQIESLTIINSRKSQLRNQLVVSFDVGVDYFNQNLILTEQLVDPFRVNFSVKLPFNPIDLTCDHDTYLFVPHSLTSLTTTELDALLFSKVFRQEFANLVAGSSDHTESPLKTAESNTQKMASHDFNVEEISVQLDVINVVNLNVTLPAIEVMLLTMKSLDSLVVVSNQTSPGSQQCMPVSSAVRPYDDVPNSISFIRILNQTGLPILFWLEHRQVKTSLPPSQSCPIQLASDESTQHSNHHVLNKNLHIQVCYSDSDTIDTVDNPSSSDQQYGYVLDGFDLEGEKCQVFELLPDKKGQPAHRSKEVVPKLQIANEKDPDEWQSPLIVMDLRFHSGIKTLTVRSTMRIINATSNISYLIAFISGTEGSTSAGSDEEKNILWKAILSPQGMIYLPAPLCSIIHTATGRVRLVPIQERLLFAGNETTFNNNHDAINAIKEQKLPPVMEEISIKHVGPVDLPVPESVGYRVHDHLNAKQKIERAKSSCYNSNENDQIRCRETAQLKGMPNQLKYAHWIRFPCDPELKKTSSHPNELMDAETSQRYCSVVRVASTGFPKKSMNDGVNPSNKSQNMEGMLRTVIIQVPLVIENLMAYDIEVLVSSVTNNESPNRCWIPSAHNWNCPNYHSSEDLTVSFRILHNPGDSKQLMDGHWSSSVTLPRSIDSKSTHQSETTLSSVVTYPNGSELRILLDLNHQSGSRSVKIYVPYWIVMSSQLPLRFQHNESLSNKAQQPTHSLSNGTDGLAADQPLEVFADKPFGRKVRNKAKDQTEVKNRSDVYRGLGVSRGVDGIILGPEAPIQSIGDILTTQVKGSGLRSLKLNQIEPSLNEMSVTTLPTGARNFPHHEKSLTYHSDVLTSPTLNTTTMERPVTSLDYKVSQCSYTNLEAKTLSLRFCGKSTTWSESIDVSDRSTSQFSFQSLQPKLQHYIGESAHQRDAGSTGRPDQVGMVHDFGITVQCAGPPYERTKLVMVVDKFLLVNSVGQDIEVRQFHQSKVFSSPINGQTILWWNPDGPRALQVKLAQFGWSWSGHFKLNHTEEIPIRLRNEHDGTVFFINVQIVTPLHTRTTGQSRMYIVFKRADQYSPYRFENHSLFTFQIKQVSQPSFTNLLPYHSCAYAWDEPEERHCFAMSLRKLNQPHHNTSDRWIPLGLFTFDRLETFQMKTLEDFHIGMRVIAQGPTRVFQIFDLRVHLNLSTPQTPSSGYQCLIQSKPILKLNVSISSFGMSLIDRQPRELLYISLSAIQTEVVWIEDAKQARVSIEVGRFQIDNQLWNTKFPTLLCPLIQWGETTLPTLSTVSLTDRPTNGQEVNTTLDDQIKQKEVKPFLKLNWEQDFQYPGIDFITSATIEVAPYDVSMEGSILTKLFQYFSTIMDTYQSIHETYQSNNVFLVSKIVDQSLDASSSPTYAAYQIHTSFGGSREAAFHQNESLHPSIGLVLNDETSTLRDESHSIPKRWTTFSSVHRYSCSRDEVQKYMSRFAIDPQSLHPRRKVYLKQLDVFDIRMNFSFDFESLEYKINQEKEDSLASSLEERSSLLKGFLNSILLAVGSSLTKVDNSPIKLQSYHRAHLFVSHDQLIDLLTKNYLPQIVFQATLLFTPVRLVYSVSKGIWEFLLLPVQGLMVFSPEQFALGLVRGSSSLLRRTSASLCITGSSYIKSVMSGLVSLGVIDSFSLSKTDSVISPRSPLLPIENRPFGSNFISPVVNEMDTVTIVDGTKRYRSIQTRPNDVMDGLKKGLMGLVLDPWYRYQMGGIRSVVFGVYSGGLGLVFRPCYGLLSMVGWTLDKLSYRILPRFNPADKLYIPRARPPRHFHIASKNKLRSLHGQDGDNDRVEAFEILLRCLGESYLEEGLIWADYLPILSMPSNLNIHPNQGKYVGLLTKKRLICLREAVLNGMSPELIWQCKLSEMITLQIGGDCERLEDDSLQNGEARCWLGGSPWLDICYNPPPMMNTPPSTPSLRTAFTASSGINGWRVATYRVVCRDHIQCIRFLYTLLYYQRKLFTKVVMRYFESAGVDVVHSLRMLEDYERLDEKDKGNIDVTKFIRFIPKP